MALLGPACRLKVDDNRVDQVLLYGVQRLRLSDVNGVQQTEPSGLFDELCDGHWDFCGFCGFIGATGGCLYLRKSA